MKISQLIEGYGDEYGKIEASGVSFSPESLKKGDLFFLLKRDEAYLAAAEKAACAIVCDRDLTSSLPVIRVSNARRSMAIAAKRLSGNACDRLKIIAVTGTNGKTTTTYMLKSILCAAGKRVGLIGTNEIIIENVSRPARLTTPDPTELHSVLAEMEGAGVEYVVMEASAHALALDKLAGIAFECVAFTNLTRDHLDFFGDMESYGRAKLRLFDMPARHKIVNADDPFGRRIVADVNAWTYALSSLKSLSLSPDGAVFSIEINGKEESFTVRIPGKYNVANALCAATCALCMGIGCDSIRSGLSSLERVEGRFNVLDCGGAHIIIDFAHTDDGLKNLLTAAREITAGRLKVVFGCGGNRDKTKRPLMGAAATLADEIFVTSDNPRDESPTDIIADIVDGIKSVGFAHYYTEPDRKKAIKAAIDGLRRGDCLVVAGKGSESYMEIAGVKHAYNDEQYIKSLLGEC